MGPPLITVASIPRRPSRFFRRPSRIASILWQGSAGPHDFHGYLVADEEDLTGLGLGQVKSGGSYILLDLARLQLKLLQGFFVHHQYLARVAGLATAVALKPHAGDGRRLLVPGRMAFPSPGRCASLRSCPAASCGSSVLCVPSGYANLGPKLRPFGMRWRIPRPEPRWWGRFHRL